MTEDELIYTQLKDQRSMYQVIFFIDIGAIAIAAAIAVVAGIMLHRFEAIASMVGMAIFFAVQAMSARGQRDSFADALAEIGDSPDGVATNRTYSASTAQLIASVRLPAKTYFSQVLAYGICAPMLYVGAVIVFLVSDVEPVVFTALSALLVAGGFWLTVLAVQAYRNWKAAKRLHGE